MVKIKGAKKHKQKGEHNCIKMLQRQVRRRVQRRVQIWAQRWVQKKNEIKGEKKVGRKVQTNVKIKMGRKVYRIFLFKGEKYTNKDQRWKNLTK